LEESEGAFRLTSTVGIAGFLSELSPLGMDFKVFSEILMSDEEVLITPLTGGKLRCGHNVTDVSLRTTELSWFVCGKYLVDDRS